MFRSLLSDNFVVPFPFPFMDLAIPSLQPIRRMSMNTDIKQTDNGCKLEIELPGYKKEDIEMTFKDGVLSIVAKMDSDNSKKDGKGNYVRRERYSGSCTRQYNLGENVIVEGIKATFKNGVLNVNVPMKKEEEKPAAENKIPID